MMDMQRIVTAETLAGLRMRLVFADGFQGIVDLSALTARGGVLAADPAGFPAGFSVSDHGRVLAWRDADGDEVDLCADALRQMAEEQRQAAE